MCNSGMRRSILPLNDICTALGDELTQCLPALHALTGCDTTSKIGTKLAALNTIRKLFHDPEFQLSTADRKLNRDGGNIFGEVSQTMNRPGDI